jgi:hypothetical protein
MDYYEENLKDMTECVEFGELHTGQYCLSMYSKAKGSRKIKQGIIYIMS